MLYGNGFWALKKQGTVNAGSYGWWPVRDLILHYLLQCGWFFVVHPVFRLLGCVCGVAESWVLLGFLLRLDVGN